MGPGPPDSMAIECQLNANSIAARAAGAVRRGAVRAKGVLFAAHGRREGSCLPHHIISV